MQLSVVQALVSVCPPITWMLLVICVRVVILRAGLARISLLLPANLATPKPSSPAPLPTPAPAFPALRLSQPLQIAAPAAAIPPA